VLGALRIPGLAAPAIVVAAVTLAAGVVLTFLPLAVPPGSAEVAAIALLVQSLTSPLARWGAGRYGDRHGSTRLLVPAVLTSALGVALLVAVDRPLAVVAGMGVFGIGFGIAQNATLVLMFERIDRADYGRASALWNLAYDAGVGVGAVGFGLLAGPLGYSTGFAVVGGVLALALGPSWLDHRRATRAGRAGSSTGRTYASTSKETA
jgi:predicted MFS family arabinose efflux permease